MIRTLSVVLAVLLTPACAAHRASLPNLQRYQQGELAGFVRAPGEQVARSEPVSWPLRRARGEVEVLSSATRFRPMGGRIDVALLPKVHDESGVLPAAVPSPIHQPSQIAFVPDGINPEDGTRTPGFDRLRLADGPTRSSSAHPTRALVVVELRGPGAGGEVRTLTTRNGSFDFGPLPDGVYTLKATMRTATVVGTIIVSDSADPARWIRVGLWRQSRK